MAIRLRKSGRLAMVLATLAVGLAASAIMIGRAQAGQICGPDGTCIPKPRCQGCGQAPDPRDRDGSGGGGGGHTPNTNFLTGKPSPGYAWNAGCAPRTACGVHWQPGLEHSRYKHVVAGGAVNTWYPADGYWWVGKTPPDGPWRVRWTPGRASTRYAHAVAADKEGEFTPQLGYFWDPSGPRSLDRIVWDPNKILPSVHLITLQTPESFLPAPGYEWAASPPRPGDLSVKWKPGRNLYGAPNVVALDREGQFRPEDGYKWFKGADPKKGDFRVFWAEGSRSNFTPGLIADAAPGTWRPAPGYEWVKQPHTPDDLRVRRILRGLPVPKP